jgi:hypothetical protein
VPKPPTAPVRALPPHRLAERGPAGRVQARRVTLAPPIARRVAAVHPALYTVCNTVPALRTHLLAWIDKPL